MNGSSDVASPLQAALKRTAPEDENRNLASESGQSVPFSSSIPTVTNARSGVAPADGATSEDRSAESAIRCAAPAVRTRVCETFADVQNRFAAKVREVRSKYLSEGWIADNSLEFLYLMDHAERCGNGFWRVEDDAL